MATDHAHGGLDHLTTVPENFDPDGDDDESGEADCPGYRERDR